MFAALLLISCGNSTTYHKVKNGTIHINESELEQGAINLIGEASFYWDTLLYGKDQINELSLERINLKNSWNNQPVLKSYPAFGKGTYHFQIIIPESLKGKAFALRPTHFIAYASEVEVDGTVVAKNGVVSDEPGAYKPNRSTTFSSFDAQSDTLNVIIRAQNYTHFRGGVFRRLEFGLVENVIAKRERIIVKDLLVIISLLIMFLYHLTLYLVNKGDRLALYFSLTCLLFSIDLSLQESMSFFLFFPNVHFTIQSFLQIAVPFGFAPSFLFFLHALFPRETNKLFRNITLYLSLILVTAVLILQGNPQIHQLIIKPHFAYVFVAVIYAYFVSVKALINKREGAGMFLLAYSIFGLCAINDILSMFEVIYTKQLVSTGMVVFVFLASIVQGKRLDNLLNANKKLAGNLSALNADLEKQVESRTKELNDSLKKLKRLNEFKEEFTNTIVHDLKTPVGTIINSHYFKDETQRTNIVRHAGYRILNLVNNILDIYKFENAELDIEQECTPLIEFINGSKEEVFYKISEKGITFDVKEGVDVFAKVDKQLIHRVFVNLFSNAANYSPRDGVITVDAELINEDIIKVWVKNQGPAIAPEYQDKIFNRFENLTEQKNPNSTGLGLTYCKMVVEAHNGEIGVKSEGEKGVDFWFTLPTCDL